MYDVVPEPERDLEPGDLALIRLLRRVRSGLILDGKVPARTACTAVTVVGRATWIHEAQSHVGELILFLP